MADQPDGSVLTVARFKLLILTLISLLFLLSSVYSYNRDLEVVGYVSSTIKSIGWASSELEMELLKFDQALDRLATGRLPADQLQLRFDLLWSRIDVLLHGAENAPLRAQPGTLPLLQHIQQWLADIDETVAGLAAGQAEPVRALQRELDHVRQLARDFNVINFSATSSVQQLDMIDDIRRRSLFYLGGLLLSGGLLLLLLLRENRRNHYLAYHDNLTGLPNRARFYQYMEQLLARQGREPGRFALHMIDLDNFKEINDSLGHEAGDQLLCAMAERLQRGLAGQGLVARIGGDEFVVIQTGLRREGDARALARRMWHLLREAITLPAGQLLPRASIGSCLYPEHGRKVAELLSHADTAMYYAKGQAGGTFREFEPSMNEQRIRARRLAVELKGAMERNELYFHYQPIFSLGPLQVEAVEALLRWQHPEYGQVPPLEIVAVAEQHGLAEALNEWVLRGACRQLRDWHREGFEGLKVNVNISPNIFARGRLARVVSETLAQTGIDCHCLVLEITEDTSLWDTSASVDTLAELRRMGVGIALDDFGTGYSSFSHLRQLPVNKLKIDKSFIQDLPGDTRAVNMVRTIIALAHHLDMRVTAEGVEEPAQLAMLQSLGCDLFQGYYLARPAGIIEIRRLLEYPPALAELPSLLVAGARPPGAGRDG